MLPEARKRRGRAVQDRVQVEGAVREKQFFSSFVFSFRFVFASTTSHTFSTTTNKQKKAPRRDAGTHPSTTAPASAAPPRSSPSTRTPTSPGRTTASRPAGSRACPGQRRTRRRSPAGRVSSREGPGIPARPRAAPRAASARPVGPCRPATATCCGTTSTARRGASKAAQKREQQQEQQEQQQRALLLRFRRLATSSRRRRRSSGQRRA